MINDGVLCVDLSDYRLGRVNALGEPLPTKASSLKRPARLRPDLANKDDHQSILPDRKIVVEPLEWWVRAFSVGQNLKCRHVCGLVLEITIYCQNTCVAASSCTVVLHDVHTTPGQPPEFITLKSLKDL